MGSNQSVQTLYNKIVYDNIDGQFLLDDYLRVSGYHVKACYDFRSLFRPITKVNTSEQKYLEYDFLRYIEFTRKSCRHQTEVFKTYQDNLRIKTYSNENEFHFSMDLFDFNTSPMSIQYTNTYTNYINISTFEQSLENIDRLHTIRVYDVLKRILHPQNTFSMYEMFKIKNPLIVLNHIDFIMDLLKFNVDMICNYKKLDNVCIVRDSQFYKYFEQLKLKLIEDYDLDNYNKMLKIHFIELFETIKIGLHQQVYQLIVIDKIITMLTICLYLYQYLCKDVHLQDKFYRHSSILSYHTKRFHMFLFDNHNKRQLKYYYDINILDNLIDFFQSFDIEYYCSTIKQSLLDNDNSNHIVTSRFNSDTKSIYIDNIYQFDELVNRILTINTEIADVVRLKPNIEIQDAFILNLYDKCYELELICKYELKCYSENQDYTRHMIINKLYQSIKEKRLLDIFEEWTGNDISTYIEQRGEVLFSHVTKFTPLAPQYDIDEQLV